MTQETHLEKWEDSPEKRIWRKPTVRFMTIGGMTHSGLIQARPLKTPITLFVMI